MSRNDADSFYMFDGLGSVTALTNASGAITDGYEYSAFGLILGTTGSTENTFLYTGEQLVDRGRFCDFTILIRRAK